MPRLKSCCVCHEFALQLAAWRQVCLFVCFLRLTFTIFQKFTVREQMCNCWKWSQTAGEERWPAMFVFMWYHCLYSVVSGPLYLSPGNQLVAWIQHTVSYFHLIKQDQGWKTCVFSGGRGQCCMMSALQTNNSSVRTFWGRKDSLAGLLTDYSGVNTWLRLELGYSSGLG